MIIYSFIVLCILHIPVIIQKVGKVVGQFMVRVHVSCTTITSESLGLLRGRPSLCSARPLTFSTRYRELVNYPTSEP